MNDILEIENKNAKHIKHISGEITTTARQVSIDIKSRNLIIIGRNGSGKTSFLKSLHQILMNNIDEGQLSKLEDLRDQLRQAEETHQPRINPITGLSGHESTLNYYREAIKKITEPLAISYVSSDNFVKEYKEAHAIIRFYEATRKSEILKVTAATALTPEMPDYKKKENLGRNLEQHLVNLEVNIGLAMRKGNKEKIQRIETWFRAFEKNLKFLFEDDSIHTIFDDENLAFSLKQDNRPPYSFQSLSSGYLAIFEIYADLLVRSEYFSVLPTELRGVVLIDEIDAHLHTSLQRKIFPFFTRSFPNIQFIVTTHSPFVVTSIDDALIYDISTGQECEDLSLFSLEHVVEGILGVPPISQKMQDLLQELTSKSNDENFIPEDINKLLEALSPHADTLDDESRMFYEIALNKYLTKKRARKNV